MTSATGLDLGTMQSVLSRPRLTTYEIAAGHDSGRAVDLYRWNAQVASALMFPMHFAEVATRNAVVDALEDVYGSNWPWEQTFERSLPTPRNGFNSRRELIQVRQAQPTAGKVVAELKFVFWQKMFTQRFDVRLWDGRLVGLFPNSGMIGDAQLRTRIYADLEVIRRLRNRMAHHEPIFYRNLTQELAQVLDLVELRSTRLGGWVRSHEQVSPLLPQKP